VTGHRNDGATEDNTIWRVSLDNLDVANWTKL